MEIQVNSEKNTKKSRWNILFWIGILAFVPSVVFLTEVSQKYFPQGGLLGEFAIAVLIPALSVYFLYRKKKQLE